MRPHNNNNYYASLVSTSEKEQSVMELCVWLYDMRLLIVDQIGFGLDLLVLVRMDVIWLSL